MTPSIEVLEAALRIKNTPELRAFADWLAAFRDEERVSASMLVDDVAVRRAQGASIALMKVVEVLDTANEVLRKKKQ